MVNEIRSAATVPEASCRSGRRLLPRAAGLVACVLLAFVAAGCAQKTMMLGSTADFEQKVLMAEQPALVMFTKGGCALCTMLDPIIDELADQYRGRAVVAKYELMNFFWIVTNPELKKKYDIFPYPTVVLFVGGEEKKRWVVHYAIEDYRKALDEFVGPPIIEEGAEVQTGQPGHKP